MVNSEIPDGFPKERIESLRAWNSDSALNNVAYTFSEATQEEVRDYIKKRVLDRLLSVDDIQNVVYEPDDLQNLEGEIESVRQQVDTGIGFVVFPSWDKLNIHQSRVASWLVGNAFGETRGQDDQGSRLIEIYNQSDRLSMKTGSRYHETREGNSPHTDAPQVINDPDYLCLRCVSDAWIGGESILVSADSIYNNLLKNAPDIISILSSDFLFHQRGVPQVGKEEFFAAPVMSKDEGGIRLRFLDHYIREGHEIAGKPLTNDQERAIQYINSLCEQSDLQFKAHLASGQQVVFANKRMLHARTEFVDRNPANEIYDLAQLEDLATANRLMDRTWSYKRHK